MLGYDHEEMLRISPLDISTGYHDPPMEKVLEELRLKGRSRFETELRRKDGSIVPVEINAHVLNHQGNKMTISVVRDISENKRINGALKLASEKLNLLSSITRHDINNQTLAIRGHVALLMMKHPELESDEHLGTIDREAGQISSMIQFTKEYEDIGVHAPIWQDVRRLVESSTKEVALDLVSVVNDLRAGTAIFADPLIVKVFHNLIQNVLRHGAGVTTIHFFIEEHDGDCDLVCEDDGSGIPANMKEKLFTKGFGKDHGLGLFLSREILAITGITIAEEGIPGKGAKFVMTIPRSGIMTQETRL
jgi:signal transduction histidine kinase